MGIEAWVTFWLGYEHEVLGRQGSLPRSRIDNHEEEAGGVGGEVVVLVVSPKPLTGQENEGGFVSVHTRFQAGVSFCDAQELQLDG